MKHRFFRTTALFLALLLLFSTWIMTACATDEPVDDTQTPIDDPTETPDDPKEPESDRLPLDYLPSTTYGGAQVHVLAWTVNQETPGNGLRAPWEEIDVDLQSGDMLDDAIYDRNALVEEIYDVVITKQYVSVDAPQEYATTLRANESSGDQAFQMITSLTLGVRPYSEEGLMTDLNTLEYLHTDMPWWNQDSVRSYAWGSTLYFAAPEMLLRDKGATAAMFYNQKIAEDEGLDDLYALAESGEWTFERLVWACEDVVADMDGDDKVSSPEDMYGIYGGTRDIPYFLYNGMGQKFAHMDEDGYLELDYGTEESVLMWQQILDSIMYTEYYVLNQADLSLFPSGYHIFTAGHSLFQVGMVKEVLTLRSMETDYGILPIPKYDEYQEDYSSLVWMHHDSVLGIPASCTNTEMISVVLEHMSYLSYYDVYPIFYDTIILGRSARDQQSKEMLQIIFRTRSFDPGQYWLADAMHGVGTFMTMFETRASNVASMWASIRSRVNTAIEAFNATVDELS